MLLEKLNKLTVTKYGEMTNTAKTLIAAMEELDRKCNSVGNFLTYYAPVNVNLPRSNLGLGRDSSISVIESGVSFNPHCQSFKSKIKDFKNLQSFHSQS